ncbi:MAG TPA: hypothetical protein ENK74_06085 [Nitratifractor sp.]|nr:hypothetical protein [Nitratifractor sp.]
MSRKLKITLPLLLGLYIVTETVLKINNIELCSSTGCALAGDLLKFNSLYLNYLGVVGALVLVVLAVVKADTLYTITAAAMVAFESLLIASQLNLNPELCKFCLGVYSFLLIILFIANRRIFVSFIPVVIAIFVAFSILSIPKNKNLIAKDGLYLIASKSCPHCIKTKEFLDSKDINYTTLDAGDINAFYFAKSLNIKKIPIAISKKSDNYQVIVGDEDIIKHFSTKKELKETREPAQTSSSVTQEPLTPKLNLSGDKGCSYSVIEEPDCEAADGSTK